MLYNPAYLGLDSFAGFAPIPGLGISATLVQGTLTLHTVWSICVPIALIEAFDHEPARPWLGKVGLTVVGVVFVVGSTLLALMQYTEFRFVARPLPQLVVIGVILALIVAALRLPWRRAGEAPVRVETGAAPSPRRVGPTAFALSGTYWLADLVLSESVGEWPSILGWAAFATGCVVLLVRTSRRAGWRRRHRLAVAGGLLLTYVWAGFVHGLELDVSRVAAFLGSTVVGAGAVVILVLAVRVDRAIHLADTVGVQAT